MQASDIMTPEHLWVCGENAYVQEVSQMMCDHNVGAIVVLDTNGRLEGIVTDRDLCCRVLGQGRSFDTPVREVMSMTMHTVHPDADLSEVESIMRENKIRRLPVVDDDDRLKGFISLVDISHHCASPAQEHDLVDTLEAISWRD